MSSEPPPILWFKGKTDGASKDNPGPSSAAFCIRDHSGSFVITKGIKIPDSTNLAAKARAIRECLEFFQKFKIEPIIVEFDSLQMVQILEGI